MEKKEFAVELTDVSTIELAGGPRHSISISVLGRRLASFHSEDKADLVNSSREIANMVAFAVEHGVDDQIEFILNRGTVLHDMFSVGSIACSCIMSSADGHQAGLIYPQDGTQVMGTVVKGDTSDPHAKVQAMQPTEIIDAARLVIKDWANTEDKEKFDLNASANKAMAEIDAKYEEMNTPLDAEKVDLMKAYLAQANKVYDLATEIDKVTSEMFNIIHPIGGEGIADIETTEVDEAVDFYCEHLFGRKYFGDMNKHPAFQ